MSESSAIDFYARTLPQENLRCATLFRGKRVTNHFFTSNAELARFIFDHDEQGNTVYHACASYRTTANRKQENVAFVRSLWLDIDSGLEAVERKTGYSAAADSIRAVAAFCSRADLPWPTLVSSGSGLHVYWHLAESLQHDQWQPLAEGLRARAFQLGLCFDPKRTADSASILRTPGTHNRKHGSNVVVLLRTGDVHPVERFAGILNGARSVHPTPQQTTHLASSWGDASHLAGRSPDVARVSLADLGSTAPRYSENIADSCLQIGKLRNTRGVLPEPIWYAALSVLAFADDGEQFAHEWSTGDSRYNPHETNKKLAQARRLSGATTCQHFQTINPAGCQGCPHAGHITSPIVLGYDQEAPPQQTVPPPPPLTNGYVNGHHALPLLPTPFAWQNESLVLQQGTQLGIKDTLISRHPIYLCGVNKSEVKGDFSLTFRQKIPSEGWSDSTVSSSDLFGPAGLTSLTKVGANIHDGELFRKYVRMSIDQFYAQEHLRLRYDQYGWKKEGFLYGQRFYTPNGTVEAAINEELTIRNRWVGPGSGAEGSAATGLDRWRNAANTLFAAGLEAQSSAVLAAFAAPLMRFITSNEGGAVLSLVSTTSGKGKTNALAGAYTVWGLRQGLGLTNSDNRVTKLLTLAALGNLPLVYDEIAVKDPLFIRDFIENFTNGRDKMRADRSGQIRHSAATWQTIMVCASNASLVDTMSTGNDPTALAYRIFELEAKFPEGLRQIVGEKLTKELEWNAGYAGEVYVQYLIQVRDQLPLWIEQALEQVRRKPGLSDPRYRFWTRLIAVIAVAGAIVRHLRLLDLSVDRIVKWLCDQAMDKTNAPLHVGPAAGESWFLTELAMFVAIMKPHTLVVQGSYERNRAMRPIETPRDKILARYETGCKHFTVNQEAMREFAVSRGFPWQSWRDALESAGIMSRTKRITLTAGTELAGAQMHCFEINLAHGLVDTESIEQKVVPLRTIGNAS